MRFIYTLSQSEIISAMQLHGRGTKRIQIILISVALLLILVDTFTDINMHPAFWVFGGAIGYIISYFIIIPYQARKQYRELKTLQSEISFDITDVGIKIESSVGNADLDWSHFKKWKYDKTIILLYITSRLFYMLPLRAIEDDCQIEQTITILTKNLGENA